MMAKGSPSMVALLGLLAVAGYQNRDKLSGLIGRQRGPGQRQDDGDGNSDGGGLLDGFRNMLSGKAGTSGQGAGAGGLASGLSELLGRFTSPTQSAKAQSWVADGQNAEIAPDDLAEAIDDETLAELSEKTGLSRRELLERLSTTLPDAVNRMTPQGRIPTQDEAASLY